MPTRAPNGTDKDPNPDDLIPVRLLPNRGGGFGYGITRDRDMPDGYDRTINMHCHDGNVVSPWFRAIRENQSVTNPIPPFAVPWSLADGTPLVLHQRAAGEMRRWSAALGAAETDATAAEYFSACFHDDGAGTAYLYAGTSLTAGYLNRRTQGATWTEDGDVRAKYIVSAVDGALWRTTSDYQISKCPAGSEPFTAGSWGSSIQVGTSEAAIVGLGAIGAAPIVFKQNGIYVYNEADDRFENKFPVALNTRNFPFVREDNAGGLYTATADGAIVHISQFGAIDTFRVTDGDNKITGRDTPRGPIVDLLPYGANLLALMAPAYRLVQPSGLKLLKTTDNFGTFTDYSANVIDGDYSTVADLSSLDTLANGDAILIGFDDLFVAIQFVLTALNGTASALNAAVSTGAGTWSSSVTMLDGTNAFANANEAMVFDLNASIMGTWVPATYNSLTKYWLRITAVVALDASTSLAEIAIVVKRAAPNFTTTNLSTAESFEASGVLPKVLLGTPSSGGWVWADVYTMQRGQERGGRLAATQIATRNSPKSSLVIFTGARIEMLPLPFEIEPSVTDYPVLCNPDVDTASLAPVFYPSAVDLGGPHELRYVEVVGQNLSPEVDSIALATRMDETHPWKVWDAQTQSYAVFQTSGMQGSVMHTAIQLLDGAATDPVGPSIREIIAWVKPLARVARQPARATPEES